MEDSHNAWIMCFDTETTGIGPEYKEIKYKDKQILSSDLANGVHWDKQIKAWNDSETYIAQLSYCMFNTQTNELKKFNKYISDIPIEVVEAKKNDATTHHIILATIAASEKASPEDKMPIEAALEEFFSDFMLARVVVAHNADFDKRMIFCELYRRFKPSAKMRKIFTDIKKNVERYFCTMCMYKDIVKINTKIDIATKMRIQYKEKTFINRALVESAAIKVPALWEVYDKLFGYPPNADALHDAMIDVIVLLRVFYRYWMINKDLTQPSHILCGQGEPDIYGKHAEIDSYINALTPHGIEPSGNFASDGLKHCYNKLDEKGIPIELYSRINGNPVKTRKFRKRIGRSRSSRPKSRSSTRRAQSI